MSPRKVKERPLSAEEAMALAKQELAPYWYGSAPLLAGVRSESGAAAHPLDPRFYESCWVLTFLDPTEFEGESALSCLSEWHRRYGPNRVGFIGVIRPRFEPMKSMAWIKFLAKRFSVAFPIAIDFDRSLSDAMAVSPSELPKTVIFSDGKPAFESQGRDWIHRTEPKLQEFLRSRDRGLPMPLLFEPSRKLPRSLRSLDLGFAAEESRRVSMRGFNPGPSPGIHAGIFREPWPQVLPKDGVFFRGAWIRDEFRIGTIDREAAITFKSPGARVSIVIQPMLKIKEPGKILVQVNGKRPEEDCWGEHLQTLAPATGGSDEDDHAGVKFEGFGLYHLLEGLPSADREITLRFPTADRVAIGIFGLRFGH